MLSAKNRFGHLIPRGVFAIWKNSKQSCFEQVEQLKFNLAAGNLSLSTQEKTFVELILLCNVREKITLSLDLRICNFASCRYQLLKIGIENFIILIIIDL